MNEMVERGVRAITASTRDFGISFGWEERLVRAVIAAMREPTQEMIEAGAYEIPIAEFDELPKDIAVAVWHAEIDAALADKETVTK